MNSLNDENSNKCVPNDGSVDNDAIIDDESTDFFFDIDDLSDNVHDDRTIFLFVTWTPNGLYFLTMVCLFCNLHPLAAVASFLILLHVVLS